jgi:soluble lytic murein transglycosylase-like protein
MSVDLTKVLAWDAVVLDAIGVAPVDPAAILAIIAQESGGDPNAEALTGGDGARGGSYGLMQMSLETARGYGYVGAGPGLLDPGLNVTLGVRYFRDCLTASKGTLNGAWQAYNSGRIDGAPTYAKACAAFYQQIADRIGYGPGGAGVQPAVQQALRAASEATTLGAYTRAANPVTIAPPHQPGVWAWLNGKAFTPLHIAVGSGIVVFLTVLARWLHAHGY